MPMLLLLLSLCPQLRDLDAVPHTVLGSSALRTPRSWKARSFSQNGKMAVLADQVHVFDLATRKLLRTVGRDRVVGDGWFMGQLDDSGRYLAVTHITERDNRPYGTTEVWDAQAVATRTYKGTFIGWGADGSLLTADRPNPKEIKDLTLFDFSPKAQVLRCFRDGKELAKAGIIARNFSLSADRKELFCVLNGPRLQIRDSRTLKETATFAIAGESDEMRLFIGQVSGSKDLVVTLGGELRRYQRDGTEVWHLKEMSSIRTHPSKPIGVAYSHARDRLVVIDLDLGKVVRVLRYANSTYPMMRPDGVLSVCKSSWHGPRFIDIETGRELGDDLPVAPSTSLQFRPNSHELLAVSSETLVWDVTGKKVNFRVPGSSTSVGYCPDGTRIFCFGQKTLRWLDAENGPPVQEVDLTQHERRRAEPSYHRGLGDVEPETGRLAFVNRRASARVLSDDGKRVLFEQLSDGENAPYFRGFAAVAFRPETEEVVTLDRLGITVHFHDLASGRERDFEVRCRTSTIPKPKRSMLFRSKVQMLLRLANRELPHKVRLGLFDPETEKQLYVIEEELAQYHDFVFSPDKKYLICVGQQNRNNDAFLITRYSFDYGLVRIYDAETGEPIATWKSNLAMTAVAVSDDSQVVAIGMSDTTVRVMKFADLLSVRSGQVG